MKNNQVPILITLLILIGAFLFWNQSIAPLRDEVAFVTLEHVAERDAAEERLRQGQIATAEYDELEARIEADEARYQAILATLPTSREAGDLINQLTNAAQEAGVTITEILPNHEEEPLGNEVVASITRLTTTGTYDQTHAFIGSIENLPRSSRLTAIELNANQQQWNNPEINLNITLETHIYRSAGGNF